MPTTHANPVENQKDYLKNIFYNSVYVAARRGVGAV